MRIYWVIMKISGLIIASDGENKKGMIDLINIPFYRGNKYLMKDKILSPETNLITGEPLISASIKAMGESKFIEDFVIVGKSEQCEKLGNLAKKYSNNKIFKVISNAGHIGETVALGAENIQIPGYFFILQPDLPFVSGRAIDETLIEIAPNPDSNISIYFPVVNKEYCQQNLEGWIRPFFVKLSNRAHQDKYKLLDFVVADSRRINPEFIRKFYNIRMIRSLKGKINVFKEFSKYLPHVLVKYAKHRLSETDLEEIGSEINGSSLKIIEIKNQYASQFMKDIDTIRDYQTYLRVVGSYSNP